MGLLDPILPDYDPLEWRGLGFADRARKVCCSWALQGYGTPRAIAVVYAAKAGLFALGWALFCSLSPSLGSLSEIGQWWLEPLAFAKAILWSALFEVLGLGCGSGPLTGRYAPPIGGLLYFLRPGTVKRPLIGGGDRRGWLDVALYLALIAALVWALCAPEPGRAELAAVLGIAAIAIARDATLFLAARGEHYLVTLAVIAVASSQSEWIAGAMVVQAALWLFAGVSKLNHHFPAVVCVMISNSPVARWPWLRRRMYRGYPDDLAPSRLATAMAHAGTALELSIPICLVASAWVPSLLVPGLIMVLVLHGFITSSVPMGVPIEWNLAVVYGAFALFGAHPEVSVLDAGPWVGALVLAAAVAVPIAGNLWPARISFLPAMRYYAGNWAMSVWLFRGECYRRLHQKLVMSSPWIDDQLARFYDRATAAALIGKVMGFRLMHLHGRALGQLVPRALPAGAALADYEWLDGELIAGLVLGWNFGDGHLHDERLLAVIQKACGFAEGELRCVFVESQPLFRRSLRYRIADAAAGELERGEIAASDLRGRQPWETPQS